MDVAKELPEAPWATIPEAQNGLRLRPIKTDRDNDSLLKLEDPVPTISYSEESWDDEPMTPAGRVFTELSMNFVCVCVLGFRYPIDRQKFKAHLESTLMRHKRFASRVETRKGRPWWTQVKTNVEDHVFEGRLTPEQKEDKDCVVNYTTDVILSKPLDESRPLWDVHLLDAKLGEAEGCCVLRIHHSLGDGTSLISLLMACTRSVDKPDMLPDLTNGSQDSKKAGVQSNSTTVMSRIISAVWKFLFVLWYSLTEIGRAAATLLWMKDSSTAIKGFAGVELSPKKYRFNTVDAEDVKYVSKMAGVTINDVFVAMAAHGLRRYLEYRIHKDLANEPTSFSGEKSGAEHEVIGKSPQPSKTGAPKSSKADRLLERLDSLRVRAVALINMRPTPGLQELSEMMNGQSSQARWGNHMGYLLLPLPMKLHSDPLELLREARDIGNRKKSSWEGPFSYASGDLLMRLFGQKAAAAVVYRATLQTSISLSNVRGPSEQVMFADNPILHIIPSVTGHPHTLTLHLQSYNGEISLVAMATQSIIPDPEYILQLCIDGLKEMKSATSAKAAT